MTVDGVQWRQIPEKAQVVSGYNVGEWRIVWIGGIIALNGFHSSRFLLSIPCPRSGFYDNYYGYTPYEEDIAELINPHEGFSEPVAMPLVYSGAPSPSRGPAAAFYGLDRSSGGNGYRNKRSNMKKRARNFRWVGEGVGFKGRRAGEWQNILFELSGNSGLIYGTVNRVPGEGNRRWIGKHILSWFMVQATWKLSPIQCWLCYYFFMDGISNHSKKRIFVFVIWIFYEIYWFLGAKVLYLNIRPVNCLFLTAWEWWWCWPVIIRRIIIYSN